jgi:WD40 repeat protein
MLSRVKWEKLIVHALLYSTIKVDLERLVHVNTASLISHDNSIIIGTNIGEIHISRLSSLVLAYHKLTKDHATEGEEGIDLWGSSRSVHSHCSPLIICHINQSEQYLFSTAIEERCIMEWQIKKEEKHWEYEHIAYSIPTDPFGEVMSKERYNKFLTEVWIPKNDFKELKEDDVDLTIEAIAGRRAHDRRGNLRYDSQDRIVSVVGSQVILMNRDTGSQVFLHSATKTSVEKYAEISCFTISGDKRIICYGTIELECRVILWDLCSFVRLASVSIKECCQVLNVKLLSNMKYAVAICMNRDYEQTMILIELSLENESKIVSTVITSKLCPFKVKDVIFRDRYGLEIVTCGIQHLMVWKLNGNFLEYSSAELTNEAEELQVAFLVITAMNDVLITSADDGKIYVWRHEKLVKKVSGHEGSIFALDVIPDLHILVSGGIDGRVVIWKITIKQSTFGCLAQLDHVREYSLIEPEASPQSYCIQSLTFGNITEYNTFNILIGTQTGDIYELGFEEEPQFDSLNRLQCACDDQRLISISTDPSSGYIFSLSSKGLFSIWDLNSLRHLHSKGFLKKAIKVLAFQTRNLVLLAFEDEVVVIKVDKDEEGNLLYEMLAGFLIQGKYITDVKINQDEKLLAIASNPEQKPQVDLYNIGEDELVLDKNIFGFRAPVSKLDFSTDGFYLMCEDNLGEVLVFELETQNFASLQSIEFEIEWMSEGIRHASGLKGVHQHYRAINKLNTISKNPAYSIVAIGDMLGILRLFNFPHFNGPAIRTISAHCYNLSICMFTKDNQALITYSEEDRAMIRWRITS